MPKLSNNQELPAAIKKLKLCSALKNCGGCKVDKAFDKSTDSKLFVFDNDQLHYSEWTNEMPDFVSKTFRVDNPKNTVIVLLPLDHKIITGQTLSRGGICDCAILTENELSFIEFKTNTSTNSYLTILDSSNKAMDQLWHTYDAVIRPLCQKVGVDVSQLVDVDFHVVFDRDLDITNASAAQQERAVNFLEENKLILLFDNDKTFE